MTLRSLLTQPVTVQAVAGATVDEYGNAVPGAAGPAVPEFGYLEQKDTTEFVDGRQTTVSQWVAYLQPDSTVAATSYVNFDGRMFQVNGDPWRVWNPRTRVTDHVEAKLIVVT